MPTRALETSTKRFAVSPTWKSPSTVCVPYVCTCKLDPASGVRSEPLASDVLCPIINSFSSPRHPIATFAVGRVKTNPISSVDAVLVFAS